jgi:type II secretory pathway pseudopilin PulG
MKARSRSRSRGYTVVELMISLAVFSAGVTGIMTMQRTAVSANRMARNVALAGSIAQAWQAQLANDASLWRANFTGTTWLKSLATEGVNDSWQLPAHDITRNFGPRFDALGNPDTDASEFCVHIRLSWLYANTADSVGVTGTAGNGTVRTDVRVFWPREGAERVTGDCTDTTPATIAAIAEARDSYYFVVETGAVRQP